jgi:hypothetical protein
MAYIIVKTTKSWFGAVVTRAQTDEQQRAPFMIGCMNQAREVLTPMLIHKYTKESMMGTDLA